MTDTTNINDRNLVDELYLCAINERDIHDQSIKIYSDFAEGYYTDLWLNCSFIEIAGRYARKYALEWQLPTPLDSEKRELAMLLKNYYHPDNYGQ